MTSVRDSRVTHVDIAPLIAAAPCERFIFEARCLARTVHADLRGAYENRQAQSIDHSHGRRPDADSARRRVCVERFSYSADSSVWLDRFPGDPGVRTRYPRARVRCFCRRHLDEALWPASSCYCRRVAIRAWYRLGWAVAQLANALSHLRCDWGRGFG